MRFFLTFLFLSHSVFAHTELKNVDTNFSFNSGPSRDAVLKLVKSFEDVYAEEFREFNAELVFELNWANSNASASASRAGNKWKVILNGGMLNHRVMTLDGLALVICHEIGHHLAGPPHKKSASGLSNEGQSDYYATLKCVRKLWNTSDNPSVIAGMSINKILSKKCLDSWPAQEDYALCVRAGMAAVSLGRLLDGDTRRAVAPKFEKTDTKVVSKTLEGHPNSQCRLDTFLAGSICPVSHVESIDFNSEVIGFCHQSNGHKAGLRPRCWYYPHE